MTVLRTIEESPDGNRWRFVTAVTETMIKTVDMSGYVFCYRRSDGMLKVSPYSCNVVDGHILQHLAKIEAFCIRNGTYNTVGTVFSRPIWNGGLRPYLKSDNTVNPQWLREDTGASVSIIGIKGITIRKMV